MTCPHGDHPACCIECLDGKPPEQPNQPTAPVQPASRPFIARYPGHCPDCNLDIHEGQTIVRLTDDTHRHYPCGGTT